MPYDFLHLLLETRKSRALPLVLWSFSSPPLSLGTWLSFLLTTRRRLFLRALSTYSSLTKARKNSPVLSSCLSFSVSDILFDLKATESSDLAPPHVTTNKLAPSGLVTSFSPTSAPPPPQNEGPTMNCRSVFPSYTWPPVQFVIRQNQKCPRLLGAYPLFCLLLVYCSSIRFFFPPYPLSGKILLCFISSATGKATTRALLKRNCLFPRFLALCFSFFVRFSLFRHST